jgi:hypothetical protein
MSAMRLRRPRRNHGTLLIFADFESWRAGVFASLAWLRAAQGARSRQIVSLFSPDTLDLLNLPGSAATAGNPHQP